MAQPDKDVFTLIPREETGPDGRRKNYFVKIGAGWLTKDGDLNLVLNALPVNGKIHVRKHESEEERRRRFTPQTAGLG